MMTTAIDLARKYGINPKRARNALRAAELPWHQKNQRWRYGADTDEAREMEAVVKQEASRS